MKPEKGGGYCGSDDRAHPGDRADPADGEQTDPHQRIGKPDRPGETEADACIGRHPLAALETEPHREAVPEDRGDRGSAFAPRPHGLGKQDGAEPLGEVEQQRRCRDALIARAEHIGRADVAAADLAHVAEPRRSGKQ